ncbi:MAG: hypothetical protein KC733_05405 [Candidatus Omnitrophica bacterium]|nr:hypothetical protein [Candidatus Omnitrophota bacterium]
MEKEDYEDEDLEAFDTRANEPTIPYFRLLKQLKQQGKLKDEKCFL